MNQNICNGAQTATPRDKLSQISRISRISDFFAEVYPAKLLKTTIPENLSCKFLSTFQFAKIYPVKIFWFFWPLSLTTEILKQAYFSADSLFFLYFSLYLECNSKEQMQNFRLRYLNKVLQILTSLFLLI